tara:strand:+ start:2270 stop:3751 length:1482 start_codon:yes stop_codon:yes gene_type:complete
LGFASPLPTLNDCPAISGREPELLQQVNQASDHWNESSNIKFDQLKAGYACALHMHQPTIPAGSEGELISHLQHMFNHPGEGDNHNAEPFAQCYKRLADIIPNLVKEGCNPRIMLDYSGNLLWGVHQMGRTDITEALRFLVCDTQMQKHVEWLGTFWSHAVAPSTPIPDLKLQISAWQHQFANLFGTAALQRVKGFSPPEMHLPNHPDTLYEFIKALKECGYQWLLVQEHSVEKLNGSPLNHEQKYIPNQLIAKNSLGEVISMIALIKTQGSDTKLVGQMQPFYEAQGLDRQQIDNKAIPSLVTQIADGENGGVMMNEFPDAYLQANHRNRDNGESVMAINGSEYLEMITAAGIHESRFPMIQAVHQQRIWDAMGSNTGRKALSAAITSLANSDSEFNIEGASWTNNLSWVEGYENILEPINQLSAQFHKRFDKELTNNPELTQTPHYQQALVHLLLSETSCFRYWGQGTWTDYAREIHRRGELILNEASTSF